MSASIPFIPAHLQVHQCDVRMEHPELLDGLATVGRLTYHNHVR